MKKSLKEKLAEVVKALAERDELVKEYRDKRYAADQRTAEAEKRADSLQCKVQELERSAAHWEAQVQRAEGHINGMRETLIGLDLMKEPMPIEHYNHQVRMSPETLFPRRER